MVGFFSTATLTWAAALATVACCYQPIEDLALQKVLDDSSEVFGDYVMNRSSRAEWMKRIDDSTQLIHMNIPGTHDSHTWNFTAGTTQEEFASLQCQDLPLIDQLNAGIRFFDLRYAMDPLYARLVFWHNEGLVSKIATVDDVMFGFYEWIDAHPSEVVFLSFQYEGSTQADASNDAAVQLLLFNILTSPAAQKYILQTKDELGTLRSARGKIVLMRRFDMDQLPASYEAALPGLHFSPTLWTDDSPDIALVYNTEKNLTLYAEDYYEPDDLPTTSTVPVVIASKVNATEAHLLMATQPQYADSLFISFASAGYLQNTPSVTPRIMAVGANSSVTPLGGVNQQLASFLPSLKGKRVGIVVLDFYEQPGNLVDAILDL